MSSTVKRWRGLKSLVSDAVEHGSRAVERVHMATSRRTFSVLEHIPPIATPAKVVHAVHDVGVGATYAAVRFFNRAASATLDVVLDVADTGERLRSDEVPLEPSLESVREPAHETRTADGETNGPDGASEGKARK